MADIVSLLMTAAFFVVCVLYIKGCERILRGWRGQRDRSGRWCRRFARRGGAVSRGQRHRSGPRGPPHGVPGRRASSSRRGSDDLRQLAAVRHGDRAGPRSPGRHSVATWPASSTTRRHRATGSSRRSSAESTGCAASTPTSSSAGPPTATRCWRSRRLVRDPLRPATPAEPPAVQPHQDAGGRAAPVVHTAVSFMTNTNWQSYGG